MKKVVDSNYLQSKDLAEYLSKSRNRFAVLTDYAAMEAYKGNTLKSVYRSMEILSDFPKQVIILKGTQTICGLSGRSPGLQRRLIDIKQTRGFTEYCKALVAAKKGDSSARNSIAGHGIEAAAHMDRILHDVEHLPTALRGVQNTFRADEIEIIRNGTDLTDEMRSKFIKNTILLAVVLFEQHPSVKDLPKSKELFNTFIFRYAFCTQLLLFEWIYSGSPDKIRPEKMRNDIVDVSFASYATYFDGLLTYDKKLKRIHRVAHDIISHLASDNKT